MAAVKDVPVPDIGDFEDVPVIEVLVSAGDEISEEQPLVVLESDKATMEVPAPFAGVVKELKVKVGDRVSKDSPILSLEVSEDGAEPAEGEEREAPAADKEREARADGKQREAPAEDKEREAPAEDDERESPAERQARGEREARAERDAPAERAASPEAERPPRTPLADDTAAYASPSVRRLARELGVDLKAIQGSGRKGRIIKDDVEAASRGERPGGPEPAAPSPAPGAAVDIAGLRLAPWPQVDFTKYGEVERVELSRIKKISGPNLARNWVMIPHVTHNDEADITELEAFRKQINAEQKDVKVTMVALLLKASVATLKEFPDFNSSLDGDHLVRKRYYHIGFATDTPGGLLVPVIRDVDKKGLLELAGELTDLSGRAREGKLKLGEMQGGTFSISSLGGIGGTSFTPIVNAPEVAILGVTRSAMKPVWDGSQFVPRLMVPLSLSYDHRVIDGAAAARFVAHLVRVLSDLRRVLL